jgi:hypothetical protein
VKWETTSEEVSQGERKEAQRRGGDALSNRTIQLSRTTVTAIPPKAQGRVRLPRLFDAYLLNLTAPAVNRVSDEFCRDRYLAVCGLAAKVGEADDV